VLTDWMLSWLVDLPEGPVATAEPVNPYARTLTDLRHQLNARQPARNNHILNGLGHSSPVSDRAKL